MTEADNQNESEFNWTKMDAKGNQELVLSDFLSKVVVKYRDSIEKVVINSSSGGEFDRDWFLSRFYWSFVILLKAALGVVTGVGRAVYYEKALLPELLRSVPRLTLVSFHFFALKEVCDRLKGRETIWSTFFAGGFSGWFYGLLRFRETVSPTRSFIAGVCASSLGLLALRGLKSGRDHIVYQWEQGAETENEFYLLRLYHHTIGEDKELERLRAKRDALYMELFRLQDDQKSCNSNNSQGTKAFKSSWMDIVFMANGENGLLYYTFCGKIELVLPDDWNKGDFYLGEQFFIVIQLLMEV
jgi:hypothetical protein